MTTKTKETKTISKAEAQKVPLDQFAVAFIKANRDAGYKGILINKLISAVNAVYGDLPAIRDAKADSEYASHGEVVKNHFTGAKAAVQVLISKGKLEMLPVKGAVLVYIPGELGKGSSSATTAALAKMGIDLS